ncbi:MAG: hypothetical protein MUP90_04840 [Gammaproteobacteria bacterium]|nr:hypothetical protein [Gammaproteobacteria bacterium]
MNDKQIDAEERWLHQQFSQAMPELPDNGFSERVLGRIRRRAVLRRSLPVGALLVGAGIAAWPAVELLGVLAQHMTVIGQFDWQEVLVANKTLVLGLMLGVLSPLLVAALED